MPVEFPSQIRPLPPNQLQRNEEELRKYLAMENAEDADQLPRNMQDDTINRNLSEYAKIVEEKKRFTAQASLRAQVDFASIE